MLSYYFQDILSYFISNTFPYLCSIILIAIFTFIYSFFLLLFHDKIYYKYEWDILNLETLNCIKKNEVIPYYQLNYKIIRWVLRRGYWGIYILGSIFLGAFVVALLLREKNTWQENMFFILPGSLLFALFWTNIMLGIGFFTWEQYIQPLLLK